MSIKVGNKNVGVTKLYDFTNPPLTTYTFTPIDFNEATNTLVVDSEDSIDFVEGMIYKFIIYFNEYNVDISTKVDTSNNGVVLSNNVLSTYQNDVQKAYIFYALYKDEVFDVSESVDYIVKNYMMENLVLNPVAGYETLEDGTLNLLITEGGN